MTEARLVWTWFRRVWRDSPGMLALIISFSFVSAALIVTLPWLWQFVIDEIRDDADPVRIRELAVWMVVVGVAHPILYVILQGARSIMNVLIQWRAREHVFAHIAQMQPERHGAWRSGDLVTRLTDDAGDKIAWFLCSGIFRAFEAFLIVVVCVSAMLWLDVRLTLWVIAVLPLLIVGQAFLQGALGRRFAVVQRAISTINEELTTTFSGIRIIQASGLESTARQRFAEASDAQRAAEIRAAQMQQAVFMMYGYGWQLALVVLLLAGGHSVLEGRITLGQYVSFEGFVNALVWPMFDAGMFVSRYKQAGVALRRLQDILDEPAWIEPPPIRAGEPSIWVDEAGVRVDHHDLLVDVGFEVAPGQLVAVVGEVGSGKTSLMQLLAGVRRPASGRVRVGGQPIAALDLAERHRNLGYVPQDPVLLSAPLRDNIVLGRDVSEADLAEALEISRLAADLGGLPDGLDTQVGERGVTLSGGQQQRVALARALVGRPRLLLLDDPTAALDADTEAAFWTKLEEHLPHITAVVVTHRVSTIQRAHQVLVLDHGRVVQQGQHTDLVSSPGEYRRIYGRLKARERLATS